MKLIKFILATATLYFSLTLHAQTIRTGTYNLRFDNKNDSGNLWAERAPVLTALLNFHDFDILGTQEGLKNQLDDISQALPQYARHGHGRDDGKEKGEHSAIYYKKEMFSLLNSGDFWLSQTPDKPGLGWDATCCNRICSWVFLQHKKSKQKFYVFNAHYDHQGVVARKESSKLILEKIREITKGQATIFMGDLNGSRTSEWYLSLANSSQLKDSYTDVPHPYVNQNGSFNAFNPARPRTDIIDHIFITTHFRAVKWGILTDSYRNKYPSDHFPVLSDLVLK